MTQERGQKSMQTGPAERGLPSSPEPGCGSRPEAKDTGTAKNAMKPFFFVSSALVENAMKPHGLRAEMQNVNALASRKTIQLDPVFGGPS